MVEGTKKSGKFGIIVGILFAGLLAGFFSGIAKRIGQDITLNSLLLKSMSEFCIFIKGLLSDTSKSMCGINFTWVAIAFTVLGIIGILLTAAKLKNWILGLIIFGVGYLFGYIIGLVL